MREKIYLIPGTMCNERLWSDLLPLLTNSIGEHYEFVHVKIPKNMIFSQITKFLNGYCKEERVKIIGFSLGGYIAAHFAITFPQRVDKTFIISNSPCALYPAEEKQRQEIVEFVNRYGYKGMSKARAAQLLDIHNGDKKHLDHLISIIINMDAELGEVEFKSQMQSTSKRNDLFEQLACSQVQSVFYYSEHDLLVNSQWLSKLKQANPNCVMKCTTGSSHMLPLENPKELADYIDEWLNTKSTKLLSTCTG